MLRVRGKEKELRAAREEHIRKEQDRGEDPETSVYFEERERDKERIRALEEEVESLKQQVRVFLSAPKDYFAKVVHSLQHSET